jgi:hypothetical protein
MMEKVATRKLFLIRPEKGASKETDDAVEKYISDVASGGGIEIRQQTLNDSQDCTGIENCMRNIGEIKKADEVVVWWKKGEDDVLFYCGISFGLGKHMRLANSSEVYKEEAKVEGKSFGKVLLMLNNEVRRPNSEVPLAAPRNKKPNYAFLICRVRNAPKEILEENQNYVNTFGFSGRRMYYPPVDTNQNDSTGLEICKENRQGIRNSYEVHAKWTKESKGSLFDLGMAVGLGKSIVLVNEEEVRAWEKYDSSTLYDKLLLHFDSQRRATALNFSYHCKSAERKT